mgnify:CR=1 FL=1
MSGDYSGILAFPESPNWACWLLAGYIVGCVANSLQHAAGDTVFRGVFNGVANHAPRIWAAIFVALYKTSLVVEVERRRRPDLIKKY